MPIRFNVQSALHFHLYWRDRMENILPRSIRRLLRENKPASDVRPECANDRSGTVQSTRGESKWSLESLCEPVDVPTPKAETPTFTKARSPKVVSDSS